MKAPDPPDHLSRASRKFWRTVLSTYELSTAELELLKRCCEAMDRLDQARKLLDEEGLVTVDKYGQTKAHPAAVIESQARTAVARLLRELKLDFEFEDAAGVRKTVRWANR
jgi:P27 family predicted phage terminase small subunit